MSVVTILPGIIDSNLHNNDAAGFDLAPSSRYSRIKDVIASAAKGEFIPKDSISAEEFAEMVVDDVVGTGKGGLVNRGAYVPLLRWVGYYAPTWLKVSIAHGSIRWYMCYDPLTDISLSIRTTSSVKSKASRRYRSKPLRTAAPK